MLNDGKKNFGAINIHCKKFGVRNDHGKKLCSPNTSSQELQLLITNIVLSHYFDFRIFPIDDCNEEN